ncbi:ABC-type multidrug transport system, ATPase component [Verrucomicrobium sp. GAS474]|uniref:ATP-binding cassette domain-containing protein n=1 Tax=Verrucomicrobium sp. GAS474 TaxID=1882831 RepID=UPI00087D82AD|nr:ABC transporter ATP-binding protein [Verrucomicrobium sp. GAS474]SDU06419.1 ABC-type multidrug transport system, ATPase component [Verrucomicrobium sp. GAS474]
MLELRDVSIEIEGDDGPRRLLDSVSAKFRPGEFWAVIGPSGCGKSTLIKTVAGLLENTGGAVFWQGRDLDKEGDFAVGELAYVPQFSIAHESLTVDESIAYAIRLRVAGLSSAQRAQRKERVLRETGLTPFSDRPVRVLSGGQRRRLALALELISDPAILLCDEVTSGLDPRSEDEIVALLAGLAHGSGGGGADRLVLSVTHSLRQAELYDGVAVLFQGRVVFLGKGTLLTEYFGIAHHEGVFNRLSDYEPEQWAEGWRRYAAEVAAALEGMGEVQQVPPSVSAASEADAPLPDNPDGETKEIA